MSGTAGATDTVPTRVIDTWDIQLGRLLSPKIAQEMMGVDEHIREGRFQRTLSLLAGLASVMAGIEVAYEHYKGSYGQRVMYTPVCSAGLWQGPACGASLTVGRRGPSYASYRR